MANKKTVPKSANKKEEKRTLKQRAYKSFRLTKPIKYTGRPLPSSWQLLKRSAQFLWLHKKTLGGILFIFGLIHFVFVQSVSLSDFPELKKVFDESIGGFGGGIALFTYMISTVGQANSAEAGVYQTILYIIASLAIIWALRELMAGKKIRIRDPYYRGMYPLIPFVLVIIVIGIQTIPAIIGAWLYGVVVSNGIAVSIVEQLFWLVIFFIFALLSFYMLCSSLMALYIVTLPNMAPMRALRSARELVRYRRWSIARKIIILIITLLVVAAIVMLPLIILVPFAVPVLFYVGSVLALGYVHIYIYHMYRELLLDE